MPTNLSIENLTSIISPSDPQSKIGSGGITPDRMVLKEMQAQGMEISSREGAGSGAAPKDFGEILKASFEKVNTEQHQADRAIKELVSGRSKNIHETMLAIERADSSLKLAMQVRNKILDAYREVMRMQV